MTRRLVALLAANDRRHLRKALLNVEPLLRQRVAGSALRLCIGTRLEADPLQYLGAETGREIRPIDALVQIEGQGIEDTVLVDALAGLGEMLDGTLDMRASAAVLGEVHVLTPGGGNVLLALATKRKPGLSSAQMHAYWLHHHGALALRLMPPGAERQFGYHQLHGDATASRRASAAAGLGRADLDGLLQVWCRVPEDFLSVATEPAFAARIFEDEQQFADQSTLCGSFLDTWQTAAVGT